MKNEDVPVFHQRINVALVWQRVDGGMGFAQALRTIIQWRREPTELGSFWPVIVQDDALKPGTMYHRQFCKVKARQCPKDSSKYTSLKQRAIYTQLQHPHCCAVNPLTVTRHSGVEKKPHQSAIIVLCQLYNT